MTSPASPKHNDLAKLAHELKTPLSAVAAASEVMRDERFGPLGDARYQNYASDIHDSARLMLELIDRMLADPAKDAEPIRFAKQDIDLNVLVNGLASSVKPLTEKSKISLSTRLSVDPLSVHADETMLKQVLLNLLSNAIKFTPPGGRIEIQTLKDEHAQAVLKVSDSGAGMSGEEIKATLSGTCTQSETLRPGRGLGIGLQLVKALSAANGATFSLTSAPGQGTVAALTFSAG